MGSTLRLLRVLDGVEMWQVEDPQRQQKLPAIHYVVKIAGSEKAFNRPQEAWRHFQQLTNAPERDTRPEPPPIEAGEARQVGGTTKPRRRRRR